MTITEIIDILGTIAFAISGASAAFEKRLDAFGVLIIAFATAIGGGTLRDVLLGITPVGWLRNEEALLTILFTVFATLFFRRRLVKLRRTLFLFDSIGISLYTLVGVELGIGLHLHPVISILLGCISACFGGVVRDILLNEIPIIFRKNIYATACLAGGMIYVCLGYMHVATSVNTVISGSIVMLIRVLAVRFRWHLPSIYRAID